MRDAPSRASKRKTGPIRKALEWTFGLLAAAVILVSVALLGVRFLVPDLGSEIREATVAIDEVVSAEDSGIGVAVPLVTIEDGSTMLRIAPDGGGTVEAGDWVRVTYTYRPLSSSVLVQSWSRTTPPPSASAGDGEAAPPAAVDPDPVPDGDPAPDDQG